MAIEVQTGITGAKRMRWKERDFSTVIARLMEEFPTAGEGEIVDRLIKELKRDADLLRSLAEYGVRNIMRAIEESKRDVGPTRRSTRITSEIIEEVKEAVQERLAELCALSMPNGKDLGDCTGKELDQMGKAIERVRKIVPANMTVKEAIEKKKLSIEQLEALHGAFKPKN